VPGDVKVDTNPPISKFTINKSVEKGFSDFRMPQNFPETGVILEQMIKDYLNSL